MVCTTLNQRKQRKVSEVLFTDTFNQPVYKGDLVLYCWGPGSQLAVVRGKKTQILLLGVQSWRDPIRLGKTSCTEYRNTFIKLDQHLLAALPESQQRFIPLMFKGREEVLAGKYD